MHSHIILVFILQTSTYYTYMDLLLNFYKLHYTLNQVTVITRYKHLFTLIGLQQCNRALILRHSHVIFNFFSMMMTGRSKICCNKYNINLS